MSFNRRHKDMLTAGIVVAVALATVVAIVLLGLSAL
jgi:hypothetical protein